MSKLQAIPQEVRDELRQSLSLVRGQTLEALGRPVATVELVLTLLETYEGILEVITWLEEGGLER